MVSSPKPGALLPVVPNLALLAGPLTPPPALTEEETRNRFLHLARAFLRAVCVREQPLALFLDDLQWLDDASRELVAHIATDTAIEGLLVVGAVRVGEGTSTEGALALFERLERAGVSVRRLTLGGLAPEHTGHLLADALDAPTADVAPLAAVVHDKTQGNPFALGEFLRTLRERDVLRYDEEARRWRWALDAARAITVSDSVAGLLAERLGRLPEATRDALRWGACVGGRFDLETLAIVRAR